MSGDNLGLKCPVNFFKRVAFQLRSRRSQSAVKHLNQSNVLNVIQVITEFQMFFLRDFCQTYKPYRHQSLKYKMLKYISCNERWLGSKSNIFFKIFVCNTLLQLFAISRHNWGDTYNSVWLFLKNFFNPLTPGGNKSWYILKQAFNKDFQVYLSVYVLLLIPTLMG